MLTTQAYTSSIGKKVIMAVSGLVLVFFITGHLLGNLLIFLGPNWLNDYAKKLQSLGSFVWIIRLFLLAVVGIHIMTAIRLTIENRKARSFPYKVKKYRETTYAARTMMFSGLILIGFIIYHILHFTFKVTNPDISHLVDALGRHDVYSMVVLSFQNGFISLVYVISMALLCFHLSHGVSSMFQSVGLNSEKTLPVVTWAAHIYALLIFLGYTAIPVSVLLGILKPVATL